MVRKLYSLTLLIVLTGKSLSIHSRDTLRTNIIIDSLGNEIYCLTENEHPVHYYSPVFTPVCLDGTCYPVRINLFWDLAGRYLKYTLNTGEILTKIEHLPFTEFDYGLLHRVITNPKSALANYTIHELTASPADSVDGVTGATRPELQGAFVPGALYTSHTLWHLVRKPAEAIQAYTKQHFLNSDQLNYVLTNTKSGGQTLALDYLLDKSGETSTAQTLTTIIDSTDSELTALCISKINPDQLNAASIISTLCKTYSRTENQRVKKEIILQWEAKQTLSESEVNTLASMLGSSSSTFKAESALLKRQQNWPEATYYTLHQKMAKTTNMMRKEKIKKLLYSREEEFPKKFRKELKK